MSVWLKGSGTHICLRLNNTSHKHEILHSDPLSLFPYLPQSCPCPLRVPQLGAAKFRHLSVLTSQKSLGNLSEHREGIYFQVWGESMVLIRSLCGGKNRTCNGPFIPESCCTCLESAHCVSETGLDTGGQRRGLPWWRSGWGSAC